MKARLVVMGCILAIAAITAAAQTTTVTNFDLEKYRQERVKAQKDLNENYKEMGFASPEERARRLEAWKQESRELSERWERERIERENAEALAQAGVPQETQPDTLVYDTNGFVYSTGYGLRNRFPNRFPGRVRQPQGYYAGGAFWPSPSPARQPILARPNRPRPRH